MGKQELLNKIMIDNSDVDFEGIDVDLADMFMVIFYLHKLQELGLITHGVGDLTPKGFDVAISLYNNGWEVEDDEILNYLHEIYGGELSNIEGLFILCREFKLIGYSGIVESLKDYKKNED